jgi:hypothetical protein
MRRDRTGTEPATARSPLRLRVALAAFGLVACVTLATWLLAHRASHPAGSFRTEALVLAVLAVAGAVAAVVDLVVLGRRLRHR